MKGLLTLLKAYVRANWQGFRMRPEDHKCRRCGRQAVAFHRTDWLCQQHYREALGDPSG
jgi:hypothetical protein